MKQILEGVFVSKIVLPFGSLEKATFIERPNRFVVSCRLESNQEIVDAHLGDPGRLKELLLPRATIFLRSNNQSHRKTKWSVILVEEPSTLTLVSVQSTLVNQLTKLALEQNGLPELAPWELVRPEFSHGSSRWDFLLQNSKGKQLLLEVKSCSLVEEGVAMFPDAVTARGAKHLSELSKLQTSGKFETAVLFVVQRSDAEIFRPAEHIDPTFAAALRVAQNQGVRVMVRGTKVSKEAITWGSALPFKLT